MPRPVRAHPSPLAASIGPLAAIAALRRRGAVVALETTRPSPDHGGQTIVAGAPLAAFTWRRGRGAIEVLREPGAALRDVALADAPSPFHALERLVDALALQVHAEQGAEPGTEPGVEPPPLGAFGYFGYECVAASDAPRLEPFPDAWFLLCDTVVHWSSPGSAPRLWTADPTLARELPDVLARGAEEASRLEASAARPRAGGPGAAGAAGDDAARADFAFSEYRSAFATVRAALARGESYQLCLTYSLLRRCDDDPLALYARLRRENPAPFAAFASAPPPSPWAIVSSSPERFLRVDRDRRVEARPMKGTAARPDDRREREQRGRELAASEKARAENLMIADLLRNDLGRVCKLGSVRASRPALLEEHATVLQLVSVIEGELGTSKSRADLLASAFPPGSMTGAPKARSIELLRAIEAAPRGPYSGALGYLACDGRMDLSVVIRSILAAGDRARVNVGGGIVWDSQVDAEFDESRLKASPLLRVLERAP